MPFKRTARGEEILGYKKQSQYATWHLPHPWLAQFEDEPPGYIHPIDGDLDRCYVKELVEKPVYKMVETPDGLIRKQVGTKLVYAWVHVPTD